MTCGWLTSNCPSTFLTRVRDSRALNFGFDSIRIVILTSYINCVFHYEWILYIIIYSIFHFTLLYGISCKRRLIFFCLILKVCSHLNLNMLFVNIYFVLHFICHGLCFVMYFINYSIFHFTLLYGISCNRRLFFLD